jgi:hypothetical protein
LIKHPLQRRLLGGLERELKTFFYLVYVSIHDVINAVVLVELKRRNSL